MKYTKYYDYTKQRYYSCFKKINTWDFNMHGFIRNSNKKYKLSRVDYNNKTSQVLIDLITQFISAKFDRPIEYIRGFSNVIENLYKYSGKAIIPKKLYFEMIEYVNNSYVKSRMQQSQQNYDNLKF